MSNGADTSAGNKPLTPNDFRDLAAVMDIFRTLGGVTVLETTSRAHTDRIEQLMQWGSAIPTIERNVERNTTDLNALSHRNTRELNDLGRRLDSDIADLRSFSLTVRTLGTITLAVVGPVAAGVALAIIIQTAKVIGELLSLAHSVKP
jgi:hypothetical protein